MGWFPTSFWKLAINMKLPMLLVGLLTILSVSDAYDPLDPNGNVTIQWDVLSFTPDGYVAVVTLTNFQRFRPINTPGWKLSWAWSKKEVIWATFGAQPVNQGDCSMFKGNIPSSCSRKPTFADLPPDSPPNWKIANCCRGGVLAASAHNPSASVSQFQITVGRAGTSRRTIKLPKKIKLMGPGSGYTCGPAKVVPSTRFFGSLGRVTRAQMTFKTVCTYAKFLLPKKIQYPTCCVSLSSVYESATGGGITPCGSSCACGCNRVCPVQVKWHVKLDIKHYWSSMITINTTTNFSYSNWNLLVQHPDLTRNSARAYNFNYKHIDIVLSNGTRLNAGLMYGKRNYNEVLRGRVRSELLVRKAKTGNRTGSYQYQHYRSAFPRKVYFNGDKCVLLASSIK